MFSNLRLAVSEDLLSLPVQKSPNLFIFRVLSLNFVTRRQAFSFGVIDLSSVCVKEHLTDCGVVVIHVFGEPLLGHGLLIELDVSLRDEVVLGLITCEGEVLVIRPHLLNECAQGYLLLNLREDEGQEEVLEDKDEEEEESEVDEKVKGVRENAQLMHATW